MKASCQSTLGGRQVWGPSACRKRFLKSNSPGKIRSFRPILLRQLALRPEQAYQNNCQPKVHADIYRLPTETVCMAPES